MALIVSVEPLASKSWLRKLLMSSTHDELRALRRTVPIPGMRTRVKSVTPSISMSLATVDVSDDGRVQRRTGNHHPNLWDDVFIQSLSSSYGASSYSERAERLTGEVKDMFESLWVEDGELTSPLNDLIQCLSMVDNVERLGISRHFENEIKAAIEYVYSYWSERGIGCGRDSVVPDLNSTALGFRILRLHGYSVSSDVFKVFEDQNRPFACSPTPTEGEIRSILNLYRASLTSFPGEKHMELAEISSERYLNEALQKILVSRLSQEVEDVLRYGWYRNLPRVEARNYIDVFVQDSSPRLNKNTNNEKLLELAKLEFNIFQSLQQRELQYMSRWWKDSGLAELTFARHRPVEYYTLASCISTEPKHSAFRMGFARMCYLITVLDDMYDTFGTMDELELFTDAIKRWNPSATEHLPEYMKGVYMVFYETVTEMVREAEKTQGRDTLNYVRKAWEDYFEAYLQEAKWISSGYLPTFEEYFENGKASFGFRVAALQPILTLDVPLPDHILQGIDFPSRFNELATSFLRLRGDTRTYKAERARGEEASCISCYMKDKPGLTEEDAVNHLNAMINDIIKELNWELLKPESNIAIISAKQHSFDMARALNHLYIYRDGFTVAGKETKEFVRRTAIESVTV